MNGGDRTGYFASVCVVFLAAEERGRTQKIAWVREFSVFSHRKVPPLGRMLPPSRGNQWRAGVFGSAGAWGGTTEERGRIAVGRRLVERCVGFQRWGSEARAVGCGVGGTTEGMKVEENCVGRGEGWGEGWGEEWGSVSEVRCQGCAWRIRPSSTCHFPRSVADVGRVRLVSAVWKPMMAVIAGQVEIGNKKVAGMASEQSEPLSAEAVDLLHTSYRQLQEQIRKVIVGQDDVIEQLLIALFSQGHVLLEGVPGLAKTLMVSTVARSLSMTFSRIQFTPDLMPADITGTDVLQENRSTGQREYRFIPGPLFHNVVLADEINRTPPKTQAALLEAMQERQVTVGQTIHRLSAPFFVLATQNPIEQEGTYSLPEAQQDRFMFKVFVKYPSFDEERQIARQTTSNFRPEVSPVLSGEQVLQIQSTVRQVPVSDHVINYTLALVRRTRVRQPGTPEWVNEWLGWGAGPRAVQNLLLGGKARALLGGRTSVSVEDIQQLAAPVLRHRITPNFTAISDGITSDSVIQRLIDETPARESELSSDPALGTILAS